MDSLICKNYCLIKTNLNRNRKAWKYNVYRKVYPWSLYEFILYNIDLPVPLKDSYNRTKKLLLRKKDKLTKLAEMLMKYETLDMEEIRLIMEGKDIVRS